MKKIGVLFLAICMMMVFFVGCSEKQPKLIQFEQPTDSMVKATMTIKDYGDIELVLYPDQAPKTVENFVGLAEKGYYDGVVFHRVIENFMIQGGDPTATGMGGTSLWNKPFEDEFSNDLYCFRGALCMANSGANTNGSQFFIVQAGKDATASTATEDAILYHQTQGRGVTEYADNVVEKYQEVGGTPHLDGLHTVFGQVVSGMDVVDEIIATETDQNDKPLESVVIEHIKIEQ